MRNSPAILRSHPIILSDAYDYADKAAAQAAGWTSTGSESASEIQWTIGSGSLQLVRGAGGINGAPTKPLTNMSIGRQYSITADIATTRAFMAVGGAAISGQPFNVGLAQRLVFPATALTMALLIWTDANSTCLLDNIVVQAI